MTDDIRSEKKDGILSLTGRSNTRPLGPKTQLGLFLGLLDFTK